MPKFSKTPYVTQKDIARVAKVSQAAVAAALGRTDKIRISPATRKRILKTATQLNYTPNQFASITRSGRSRQIAVIANGAMLQSVVERLRFLAKFLGQRGLKVVSHELEWTNRTLDQAWDEALASRAEGIILSSSLGSISTSLNKKLLSSPVPTISLYGPDISGLPLLAPDLRTAFRELTSHLIQSERRNLVFLKYCGSQESEVPTNWKGAERMAGFLDAVREYDIEEFCSTVDLDQEAIGGTVEHHLGVLGLTEILTRSGGQPPDAVICVNDNIALGVISEAVRLKIDIPGQMAVTGCDGEDWTGFGAMPITTIVQPSEALARSASELLLAMLEGKSPAAARTFLPCEIIWRQSCPKN